MTNQEIGEKLLIELYEQWCGTDSDPELNVDEFCAKFGLEKDRAWRTIKDMDGISVLQVLSPVSITSTPHGILMAEHSGEIDAAKVRTQIRLREELLVALREHENAGHDPFNFEIATYINQHNLSWNRFHKICDVLEAQVFLQRQGNESELTPAGRKEADRVLKVHVRPARFTEISSLEPHNRGRQFQQLVGEMLEQEGYNMESGIRSAGEELDIVFSNGTRYYLAECRWVRDPVEAKDVRDFKGKLDARIASVIGCFISMSGFTQGAVKAARDFMGQRTILLFGPNDIQQWIDGRVTFEYLLFGKIDSAIKRRTLEWN